MAQRRQLQRLWRHMRSGAWAVRRAFGPPVLAAIEQAVRDWERRHPGEIRFAVEADLPLAAIWAGVTPRQRALQVFANLGVWDTEHNNGVLIYVLLADRDVEIVADRGVARSLADAADWESCCRVMEAHFAEGRYRDGAIAGIEAVAAVLARHPADGVDVGNELPDAPVVL
jgi:uncharacterized membrane protein